MAPNDIPDMRDPAVLELVLCLLEVDPSKTTEINEKKKGEKNEIMNNMNKNPMTMQSVLFKTSTFEHKGTDYHADWSPLTSTVDRTFSPVLVTTSVDSAINEVQLKQMLSEIKVKLEIPVQTRIAAIAVEQHPNIHRRSFLGKILPEFSYGTFTAKTNEHYKMSGKMYYDFKDSASSSRRKDKLLLLSSVSPDVFGSAQNGVICTKQNIPLGRVNNEYLRKEMSCIDCNLMPIEEGEKEKDMSNDDNIVHGHSILLKLLPAAHSTPLSLHSTPLSLHSIPLPSYSTPLPSYSTPLPLHSTPLPSHNSDVNERQTISGIGIDIDIDIDTGSSSSCSSSSSSNNRGNKYYNDMISERDIKTITAGSLSTSSESVSLKNFILKHQHYQSQSSETKSLLNRTGQDEYGNESDDNIRLSSQSDHYNRVENLNVKLHLDDVDSRQFDDTDGIELSISNINMMNSGGKRVVDLGLSNVNLIESVTSSQV